MKNGLWYSRFSAAHLDMLNLFHRVPAVICGLSKNEGGRIYKKKGWRHASKIKQSRMNQSPAQVGVMGWDKCVSHGECRDCRLTVSVLFLLSPCVEALPCVPSPNQPPFTQGGKLFGAKVQQPSINLCCANRLTILLLKWRTN